MRLEFSLAAAHLRGDDELPVLGVLGLTLDLHRDRLVGLRRNDRPLQPLHGHHLQAQGPPARRPGRPGRPGRPRAPQPRPAPRPHPPHPPGHPRRPRLSAPPPRRPRLRPSAPRPELIRSRAMTP